MAEREQRISARFPKKFFRKDSEIEETKIQDLERACSFGIVCVYLV